MIPYLHSIDQPDVIFCKNKIELNEEFYHKARLTNLVGILYYPTQVQYFPLPHFKLELEGRCYVLCGDKKDSVSLEKKISSALYGNLAFVRIGISVTPKQLKKLKENVKSIDSDTCSKGVADALRMYADFKIPFIISFGPTLSASYLLLTKKMGNKRITSLDYYFHYNSTLDKVFKVSYPALGLIIETTPLSIPLISIMKTPWENWIRLKQEIFP